MSAVLSTPKTTSGGEIIRELVNATDGQGLHFDGVAGSIDIAGSESAPVVALGTKFSFEFIIQADSWNTSGNQHFLVDFGASGRFIFGTKYPMTGELGIQVISTWT